MDHIIEVTELALRDARQSLIATRLGIDDMIGAQGLRRPIGSGSNK